MTFQNKIFLNPIGHVKTEAVGDEVKDKSRISQIILRDELVEALEGVDGFSHLFVLFWLNQISNREANDIEGSSKRQNGHAFAWSFRYQN